MQSGLKFLVALALVFLGGWIMYAVVSGSSVLPGFVQTALTGSSSGSSGGNSSTGSGTSSSSGSGRRLGQ